MASGIQGLFDNLSDGLVILAPTGVVKFANQMVQRWLNLQPGKTIAHDQIKKYVQGAQGGYQRLPAAFIIDSTSRQCSPSKLQVVMDHSPLGEGYALVVRNRTQEERYDTVMNNFADLFQHGMAEPFHHFMRHFAVIQRRCRQLAQLPEARFTDADRQWLAEGNELLEKVTLLSSYAFAFSHAPLFASERIEPLRLINTLSARVAEKMQRTRLTLKIHTDNRDMPVVYGSEAWLLEALNGYFHYLADHAHPGTAVEIQLKGFGNFVLFVITNHGCAIPVFDREERFKPFLSTAVPGADKPNLETRDLGLGLPLCRKIIELHKGNLRMQEEEGELVSFEIELPAGAPVSVDQHEVSAEQAKRYAEDLALLMQRQSRKKASDATLQVVREGVSS